MPTDGRRTPRVLLLGEIVEGALYHSYRRGFEQLGWEVVGFCLERAYRDAAPSVAGRVGRRLLESVTVSRFNDALPRRLAAAVGGRPVDLVLALKAHRVSAESVREIRSALAAPVVNFYPDDPFDGGRASRVRFGGEALASYDHCFIFARHLIPAYQAAGAVRVSYLPFARDPELHTPPALTPEPEFDLVFVGNIDAERVRWLEAVSDFRLAVFGELTRSAVPARSALRRAAFYPARYGGAFAQALHLGAISLNVMRHQNRLSHNMRSFESPACAAFTLSQRTPELVELFHEGEEVAFFGDEQELHAQVEHWLARPEARRAVAQAGFRRVEHDTYAERVKAILAATGLRHSEAA